MGGSESGGTGRYVPEVVIDGVRYVPATTVSPDALRVTRALVEQFMGTVPSDAEVERLARKSLFVYVTEEPEHGDKSIEQFVAELFTDRG